MMEVEITNPSTGESATIRASRDYLLEARVKKQLGDWEARHKTAEVQAKIESLNNILQTTLEQDDKIDWKSLLRKANSKYFNELLITNFNLPQQQLIPQKEDGLERQKEV